MKNYYPKGSHNKGTNPSPRGTFPFTDCISRIKVTDARSQVVAWLMEHAQLGKEARK